MLSGRIVLVTGSSRGLGFSIAKKLAEYNATVIMTYNRSKDEAQANFETVKGLSNKSLLMQLDVCSQESIELVFKTIDEQFGHLDILVNNAGLGIPIPLEDIDLGEWNYTINTNLTGPFLCTKYAVPLFQKASGGRIVNITSVAGLTGGSFGPHYGASKAGLIGLTKSTARDLAKYNITVNAIAPGPLESEMTDSLDKNIISKIMDSTPIKRFGKMDEVAEMVCQIVNPKIDYITGQTITIDGGRYMN